MKKLTLFSEASIKHYITAYPATYPQNRILKRFVAPSAIDFLLEALPRLGG